MVRRLERSRSGTAFSMWICIFLMLPFVFAGKASGSVEKISTVNMPHRWGVDFIKSGNYLYCTGVESQRKFYVIDVTNPENMHVVAENPGGLYAARNLTINGNNDTVLIDCYRRFNPIDVTNPLTPQMIINPAYPNGAFEIDSYLDNVPPFYRFQWVGSYLYVACGKADRAFRIYSVTTSPFALTEVGRLDLSSYIDQESKSLMVSTAGPVGANEYPNAEMIVNGRYVYTSYGKYIVAIDAITPSAPALLYCTKMAQNVVGMTLSGDGETMYVAMNNRAINSYQPGTNSYVVAVFNQWEHGGPYVIGEYHGMEIPERMLISGNTMYLAGAETIPAQDRNFGSIPFPKGLIYFDTLTRRTILQVLDITDPMNIQKQSQLNFPLERTYYDDAVCRAMALDGNVLYAAHHEYGIRAINVQDPYNSVEIGHVRTVTHEIRGVVPAGNQLYVFNMACATTVDISDILNPVITTPDGYLSPVSMWLTPPVLGPNPRYSYSVSSASFEVTIADYGIPGGTTADIVNFVPLPYGWGARALGWSGNLLYVLGTQENQWMNGRIFVYEPVADGSNLSLVRTINIPPFTYWIGWVWGTDFLVTADRVFVMNTNFSSSNTTLSVSLTTIDIRNPASPVVYPTVNLLNAPGTPAGTRFTYISGAALSYLNGYLYFYAIDEAAPGVQPSYLVVYNMSNPATPTVAGILQEPPTPNTYNGFISRNTCLLTPAPYIAFSSEQSGAWLVNISDPANPVTTWKETFPPLSYPIYFDTYDKIAKPILAYQNGYLFIPRLDRLDIFNLDLFPGAPTNVSATPGLDGNATVTFTAPASNGGTYTFTVTATNAVGAGPASTPSNSILEGPLTAPANLTAVISAQSPLTIRLTWTSNAYATGYSLQRATSSTFTQGLTTYTTGNVTTYLNNIGLQTNRIYYYRVKATNGGGDSGWSNTASMDTHAPARPSNLSATPSETQVVLNWTATGLNIGGFVLQRLSNSSFSSPMTFTLGPGIRTYTDTGLNQTTNYYYRIRAYNATGSSGWRNATPFRVQTPNF